MRALYLTLSARLALPILAVLIGTGAAIATPTLKPAITVVGPIVTVGDMFDDAGLLAGTALFRAPSPGTTGDVSLAAITAAATRAGLVDFSTGTLSNVAVSRAATPVDATMLAQLVGDTLLSRGIVAADVSVETRFDQPVELKAEADAEPARLLDLRYQPGGKAFVASFAIAGFEQPLQLTGRIDLTVLVPHLANTLPAGAVLTPANVEMKQIPLEFADRTGIGELDQLVGKSLKRNARAGLMLKTTDVEEPVVIKRNAAVTVLFRSGPMVLSVSGTALTDAAAGGPVQVMNSVSHKILSGIATADGNVEVGTGSTRLAGL